MEFAADEASDAVGGLAIALPLPPAPVAVVGHRLPRGPPLSHPLPQRPPKPGMR